jgi:hypothetical protein
MTFERRVKTIARRDWAYVQRALLSDISQYYASAGRPPGAPLSEMPGFVAIVGPAEKDGPPLRGDIKFFRGAMLHEGIFLLHKSANVLCACHDQAVGGLPSWSAATGYQAALFAAEATMRVLGVAGGVEHESKEYLFDLWPEAETGLSKRAKKEYVVGTELLVSRHERIQHFHRWMLFQRVLRMTENHGWPDALVEALLALHYNDFARQRNDLHYELGWIFDDLHTYLSPLDLFRPNTATSLVGRLKLGAPDFSIALGTAVFALGSSLLRDLAALAPVMQDERSLLVDSCSEPRMKLRRTYESCGVGSLV